MQFNANRAKEAGIDTGAAVVGAVVGLAASNKIQSMIAEKSPSSTLVQHVPAALLVGIIAAQAFDIVPQSQLVDSALQGIAVVTGMQAVRQYTGANTAEGMTATTGIAALVNQYVPLLSSGGAAAQAMLPASGTSAASLDAAAALQGLGLPLVDYRDPGTAMMMAGREQQAYAPQTLGIAAGPSPMVLG